MSAVVACARDLYSVFAAASQNLAPAWSTLPESTKEVWLSVALRTFQLLPILSPSVSVAQLQMNPPSMSVFSHLPLPHSEYVDAWQQCLGGNPHIVDGEFQSDKYPTCPRGKVPLSVADSTAHDLLWEYAHRRRSVDADFSDALEACLLDHGYKPKHRETRRVLKSGLEVKCPTCDADVGKPCIGTVKRTMGNYDAEFHGLRRES